MEVKKWEGSEKQVSGTVLRGKEIKVVFVQAIPWPRVVGDGSLVYTNFLPKSNKVLKVRRVKSTRVRGQQKITNNGITSRL